MYWDLYVKLDPPCGRCIYKIGEIMINCKNVFFSYEKEEGETVLSNINLNIEKGETILLCGGSGCGKTTMTRLFNGLIPHYYEGRLKGEVTIDGKNVRETPLYELSAIVGSVFQNPRSQFFSVDTTSELVFGCENLSMDEEEILCRMNKVVNDFSIKKLMGQSIFNLSGGEKQKIACAGVSMVSPKIVVLDEPTSNLDLAGIGMLKEVLKRWKEEGKTIIIAEHRLWFLNGIADRVIYLEKGKIKEEYSGTEFYSKDAAFYKERGLRSVTLKKSTLKGVDRDCEKMILENIFYSYTGKKKVLSIPKLELPLGQALAIVGNNGAGKSTLIQSVCGLLKHDKSVLTLHGKKYKSKKRISLCYPVMQDVDHQLFTESVMDEVLLSMEKEEEKEAERYLEDMDLLPYKEVHPMALSGGQKQRVAIASALASQREIIIFDEPTSGLDLYHMEQVAECIRFLKRKGKTILVVTHDTELITECCDLSVEIREGCLEGYHGYKKSTSE